MAPLAVLDGSPHPPALGDILRARAALHSDRIALHYGDRTTSYGGLLSAATRVCNALRRDGLKAGDRVAILSRNDDLFFELLFGAALAGIVLLPVNWRLSAAEIAYILTDSTAKMVFVGEESEELAVAALADIAAMRIIPLNATFRQWHGTAVPVDPRVPVDPHDVALQLYTSGTTGRPKGALLTHHSLNSVRVSQSAEWSQWGGEDICLISMPLFHVGGIGTALAALYHGAQMVIVREFSPEILFDCLEHYRITKLFLVPAAMRMVLDHPCAGAADFGSIRYMLYGSSPMNPLLLREAMAVFRCDFVQVYGMTETSGTIVALPPEAHRPDGPHLGKTGKPLAGVEIRILGPDGVALPVGVAGEIAIRSEANMAGYWHMPDASRAALTADGFLLSGDVGFMDADGYLTICDRIKDMIISGGENVYAVEVEAMLCTHPAIAEAAVIGVPDEKWGEVVKAVLVLKKGAAIDLETLGLWARERLAAYKIPRLIAVVDDIPKDAGGKLLRRMLR